MVTKVVLKQVPVINAWLCSRFLLVAQRHCDENLGIVFIALAKRHNLIRVLGPIKARRECGIILGNLLEELSEEDQASLFQLPRVAQAIGDWNNSGSGGSGSGSRSGTLGGGGSSGGGGARGGIGRLQRTDDDEDSEDDGKKDGETWFAGGDRSGISVQNSGHRPQVLGGGLVRDILRRAADPGASSSQENRGSAFTGGGHTLGGDDVESSYIPDPNAPQEEEPVVLRYITFWRNGFSVEGGEFYAYNDPGNEEILAQIHRGRAPPSILNVRSGEAVEVRLTKKTEEDYVPPKYKAFAGTGNRLGAPVPGTEGAASSAMPGTFPASTEPSSSAAAPRESITTRFQVDQTLPTTSVQIRLADGTRMVARMNLTHKVQDIRNFINASRPENVSRPYTIATTFPNRVLEDNNQTIEAAGLANSVIVHRWA